MFEIEKNVPAPEDVRARTGASKYLFDSMEIGDSFLVGDKSLYRKVQSSAAQYAKKYPGYRFTSRITDEGMRVWRIPV